MTIIPLIPLIPFVGFLINGLSGSKLSKSVSGFIGSGAVFISFVLSFILFFQVKDSSAIESTLYTWLNTQDLAFNFGFYIDHLSAMMMLIVTGIGFLIHIYSIGYMHHDAGFSRFFSYLNLFIFSMLLLIMGNNYIMLFFGWEGVGLCSYLLIGFWYQNVEYGVAARKAFIMNRIGDLGLLLGIFSIWKSFGTTDFSKVFLMSGNASDSTITVICILLFIGAMGKSAQIPLYTWLPDAMAGPTPVSALIHAATMVTAGIYMVCRSATFFASSPLASDFVLYIGLFTAFFAATIGLLQNDIKKVLAYSTVSQLGFMFVALGVGAYSTAMFHVTTHAFFKALLFLGSGSVIHAMGGEQDIRNMGGLKNILPVTHLTFLIGTLAIAGIPPLAGFFSKDEILTSVYYSASSWVFYLLIISSILTAVYMFRLYFMTFGGKFRGTDHAWEHAHESPVSMTLPLIVLSVLSVLGGFLGTPDWFNHLTGSSHVFKNYLSKPLNKGNMIPSETFEFSLLFLSIIVLTLIWFFSKKRFTDNNTSLQMVHKGFYRWIANKYYVDEFYYILFQKPILVISELLYKIFDRGLIDGIVNGLGSGVKEGSFIARILQNGKLELYISFMSLGFLLILILNFLI